MSPCVCSEHACRCVRDINLLTNQTTLEEQNAILITILMDIMNIYDIFLIFNFSYNLPDS